MLGLFVEFHGVEGSGEQVELLPPDPTPEKREPPQTLGIKGLRRFRCGPDGTRTRDLRRDRAAF